MKKSIGLYIVSGFLLMSSGMALANCPTIDTIRFKCAVHTGGRNCTWQVRGGWWEGTTDTNVNELQTPSRFMKALWFPYQSDDEGATECFYYGPNNEKITLYQSSRVQPVPQPTNPQNMVIWTNDSEEGFPVALKCEVGIEDCEFSYGNVQS